ncbi:MAG TPA: hypothetical protein VGH12_03220 [Steroidobacteraceae bacterium]|jgi:hypothetical protein
MLSVTRETVPSDSLLKTFRGGVHPERWGRYADCFETTLDRSVNLAEFVHAFYTSPAFRIERFLLRVLIGVPSSESDARAVAEGSAAKFAAWYVGERTPTQLLMCDRYERTRSWFSVMQIPGNRTRLRFGSAVADARDVGSGAQSRGGGFRIMLRFHLLYSQVLLHGAKARLLKASAAGAKV